MAFVSKVTVDAISLTNPTWDQVAAEIERIFSTRIDFVQMFGEGEAQMMICPAEEYGGYVSAFGKDELVEYVLVDPTLGMSSVVVFMAGCSDAHPRCVFIEKSMALQATRKFYQTGIRDNELTWAKPFELYAKAGIH